jgi:hypothetical protein
MTIKRVTFLLLIPLLLAISAGHARADIADTFNMKELKDTYAQSCTEQSAKRHGNILPPYFPGRPKEFQNDSDSLVVYSPYLTPSERQEAEKLVDSIPAYALPIAWRGGAVYVFTRRGIVEAVPALAVERDWFEDFGLYMEVERRLYVPFEKGEAFKRKSDGSYVAQHWVPSPRDRFRIINHETGHMIDNMLGEYSLNSKGDDGYYRLSNRPDFLAAIKSDLSRLKSAQRPISVAKIHKLGYYMPFEFEGMRMGIQTEQRARREVFAELWAEAHGHDSNKLSSAYPDAFRVVKALAVFLKTENAAAPVHCKLRD